MSIKIGNTNYSDIYLGSTGIQKAYLGSTLVYNKEVTPTGFPTTNLTAYYRLDDGSGTVATNALGGTNGVLSGTLPTWVTGKNNTGLRFVNNTTNLVTVNNNAAVSFSGQFTISSWVYPTARHTNGSIFIHKGYYPTYNYTFNYSSSGSFIFNSNVGSSTPVDIVTTSTYAVNNWYLVTGMYDGTGMKLYVNAVLAASNSQTGTVSTVSNHTYFGRFINQPQLQYYGLSGTMDEIGFWSRALTLTEVQAIYNNGNGLFY